MNTLFKKYLLFILFLTFFGAVFAQRNPDQEANLKAAFIYNFTKYIDWGNYDKGNNFVIGVAGDSPIFESLQAIARVSRVNDKMIVVKKK